MLDCLITNIDKYLKLHNFIALIKFDEFYVDFNKY